MSESPYRNLDKARLIEMVEQRDRQIEQAQERLAEMRQRVTEPLCFPDGQPVTPEALQALWSNLQRPEAPLRIVRPDCYRRLCELGKRDYLPVTVAKVSATLRAEVHRLHYWLEQQAGGEGHVKIKDWILLSQLWRVGTVVIRTCPDLESLPRLLPSTSDESVEQVLRTILMRHVANLFGWKEELA